MTQKEAVKKEVKQKPNIKYLRDKAAEKVTGIFRFYEVRGGSISFNFREYKPEHGTGIEQYDLVDGETYTIPLGVARHLNNNGWYPEYGYVTTEAGIGAVKQAGIGVNNRMQRITRKIHRYGFQSLEFVDIDDLPTADKEIVEVQTVG